MGGNMIKFTFKIDVDGVKQLVTTTASAKELQKALGKARTKSEVARNSLVKWGAMSASLSGLQSAFQGIAGQMQGLIGAYAEGREQVVKLSEVMKTRMGATEGDVEAIQNLAEAQMKLGVVDDDNMIAGAQQVATFLNQRSSIEKLLPAMSNLAVQQHGLNVSSGDMVNIANLMGKAMQGQTGALTRVGITFDESQKKVMKYGNESERAAMLAEIITDNVGNMNAEIAKTDAGKAKQMANEFDDMGKQIGGFLSKYQVFLQGFSQISMTVTGIAQLTTGVKSLFTALRVTAAAQSLWNTRSVMGTAIVHTLHAAFSGAAVGATTLKFAIRGLLASTVVGAAIVALGFAVEKLVSCFSDASEEADKTGASIQTLSDRFGQHKSEALAPMISEYQKLQAEWKTLKSSQEKNEFIKNNSSAFQDLGVSVGSVSEAENFLVKNTSAVTKALNLRAEAAANAALAQEKYEEAIRLEHKYKAGKKDLTERVRTINNQHARAVGNTTYHDQQHYTSTRLERIHRQAQKARGEAESFTKENVRLGQEGSKLLGQSRYGGKHKKTSRGSTGGGRRTATLATAAPKAKATPIEFKPLLDFKDITPQVEEYVAPKTEEEIRKLISSINPGKVPLELDFDDLNIDNAISSVDKLKESLDSLRGSFGGQGLGIGDNIMEIVKAFQAIPPAARAAKADTTGANKGFSATAAYASAGAAGLSAIGSTMEQIGGKGAAAKAGAVMAAIGQIVLGFATYTAQSAGMGPWGWVAAIASGLAVMATTIATIQGYEQGGALTGPTSHGDKLLFRGNAGEMIFNTSQQRRLYALANGDIIPRRPKMETVQPRLNYAQIGTPGVHVTVSGKVSGQNLLLLQKNSKMETSKVGKRW